MLAVAPSPSVTAEPDNEQVAREAHLILTRLAVRRLHYTYHVTSFGTFRETWRYTYSDFEGLSALPLFWRRGEVQTNMVVTDAEGRLLPTAPSGIGARYTRAMLGELAGSFLDSADEPGRASTMVDFGKVAALADFETDPPKLADASAALGRLRITFRNVPGFDRFYDFASRMERYYLPFVVVSPPVTSYLFELCHEVDINRQLEVRKRPHRLSRWTDPQPSVPDRLLFAGLGLIDLNLPIHVDAAADPPWSRTDSLHLQLNLPAGVTPREVPTPEPQFLFEGTGVAARSGASDSYVYSYISGKEAKAVRGAFEQARDERNGVSEYWKQLAEAYRVAKPGSKPSLGPVNLFRAFVHAVRQTRRFNRAKKPLLRSPASVDWGVGLLTTFLWIVATATYGLEVRKLLSLDDFLSLFSTLMVVVLTVSVYSLEKPFARYPVFSHVAAATVVFFALLILPGFRFY